MGRDWIGNSVKGLKRVLEEMNTMTEAVMAYELARLAPAGMELDECIR